MVGQVVALSCITKVAAGGLTVMVLWRASGGLTDRCYGHVTEEEHCNTVAPADAL